MKPRQSTARIAAQRASQRRSPQLRWAVLALLMGFVASPASAQEAAELEEIVVTAEFRSTSVNRTPASVSVVELDDLKGRAVQHLEDVLAQVPNVNFAGGSSRARFYQIRGIGERGQFEEPMNASVGLLIDGVDFSGIGTAAVLHDVSQLEVLRGPQGTIYGANALAGLMSIRTNDPTREFEGGLSFDAGNYDALGVGLTLSGPLGESLAGRVAVRQYQDDGFYKNTFLDETDTNNRDELSVRGRLDWAATEGLDLGLTLGHVDVQNGYDAFSLDNDRRTRSDEPGQDAQKSTYGALTADWLINDAVILEGSLGHATSKIAYGYDEDWTFVGFDPIEYSSTDLYERDRDTTTLDLRLLSGESGKLFADTTSWVVGVYGLSQEVDLTRTYTYLPAPFDSSFEIDRVALYGEFTSELGERARLTFGLRGERHESSYEDSDGVSFDPSDDLWGGAVDLRMGSE